MLMFKRGCLLLLLISAACGTPTAPSSPAASYVGTIQDTFAGTGTLHVTLSTYQGLASGDWVMTFPDVKPAPPICSAGRCVYYFRGTLLGATLMTDVQQSSSNLDNFGVGSSEVFTPDCKLRLTGLVTAGRMTGTYSALPVSGCPDRTGTIDLTAQ
jgi:hypothetical protein